MRGHEFDPQYQKHNNKNKGVKDKAYIHSFTTCCDSTIFIGVGESEITLTLCQRKAEYHQGKNKITQQE